jgi:hypothetical protein
MAKPYMPIWWDNKIVLADGSHFVGENAVARPWRTCRSHRPLHSCMEVSVRFAAESELE